MSRLASFLTPDRAASLGVGAMLVASVASLSTIDPAVALAWLGSTAVMSWRAR